MYVEENVRLCAVCRGTGELVVPTLFEDMVEPCWRCRGQGYRVVGTRIVQDCVEPFPIATD
jgi:DnaJ-class molecular chaperone